MSHSGACPLGSLFDTRRWHHAILSVISRCLISTPILRLTKWAFINLSQLLAMFVQIFRKCFNVEKYCYRSKPKWTTYFFKRARSETDIVLLFFEIVLLFLLLLFYYFIKLMHWILRIFHVDHIFFGLLAGWHWNQWASTHTRAFTLTLVFSLEVFALAT